MSDHPEWSELEALLADRLDGSRAESIVEHLADCDRCMALADQIWGGLAALSEDLEVPSIDAATRWDVERSVFRRIHRADAGSQLARLMTDGLLAVILALLRPLVATGTDHDS